MRRQAGLVLAVVLLTVPEGPPYTLGGVDPGSGKTAGKASSDSVTPAITGVVNSVPSSAPIAGALVEVLAYPDHRTARERRLEGRVTLETIASSKTDDQGRFRVAVPPETQVLLVAQAPKHARSQFPRPLYLTRGSELRDVGLLNLTRGRSLAGQVLGPDGKPIAGATVVATPPRIRGGLAGSRGRFYFSPGSEGRLPEYPVIGTTDADGKFQLESVGRRPVSVRVHAASLAPALVEKVGATQDLVIRMTAGRALTGSVVAPDKKTPVADAWVMVGEEGQDGITKSGSDGAFRLDNLRPGPVSIIADLAGAGADRKGDVATLAPSAPLRLTLPVEAQGDAPEALLRLRPGGVFRIRAVDSETRGPVAAALVTLNAPGEAEPRTAITTSSGEVAFAGVPAGRVSLDVEAEGYLEENLQPVPLAAGQTRDVSAALRPAAAVAGTVRDLSGSPVAGATVFVRARPEGLSLPASMSIFLPIGVDPVKSDAQGRFVLERLPPREELKIGVSMQGFAPWDLTGIKLRPGERRAGLEVLLDPGAVIAGRLTDSQGRPISEAEIEASRSPEGAGGRVMIKAAGSRSLPGRAESAEIMGAALLPSVKSDAEGTFRIAGVSEGIWSLGIKASGYAPKTVSGLRLESSDLDAGEIILEPGVVIRGQVVSRTGEPVPFATGRVRRGIEPLLEFTTDGNGSFVTGDMSPADLVTLTISAPSYATFEQPGLAPPLEDLVITLSPSSSVLGAVVEQVSRDPVIDFSISISRTQSGGAGGMQMVMLARGPERAFHSEDGTFTVDDVDPGKIVITARAPGWRDVVLRDLEIAEGENLEGVVLEMEKAASVSGTVHDEGGQPIGGVTVSRKQSSSPGMMLNLGDDSGATTDGDGEFHLEGLERGPMMLSFDHPDYEPAERDVDTTADVKALHVTLSRGATITGIVLHEEDGSPISRANVTATAAGGSRISAGHAVSTGPDGSFFLDAVAAGRYTIRAEATGLRSAVADDVVVTAGSSPPPIELRMGGGVTLFGTVTGLSAEELPRFTVRSVNTIAGGFGVTTPVDATGRFEIAGLPPGPVTLLVASGFLSGRSVTKTLEIPDDVATFETVIEFPSGNTVEGVVMQGDRPVEGASVIFTHSGTRARSSATADASGYYIAENLADGDYGVAVLQFSRGVSHSTTVSVHADMEFDIAVPSFKIYGIVTDSDSGAPLDGVAVSVNQKEAANSSSGLTIKQGGRSDTSGYYEVGGLEAGNYEVTAQKEGFGYIQRAVRLDVSATTREVSFDLSRVDPFRFRAVDAATGSAPRELSVMVQAGGGDPLLPGAPLPDAVYQGRLSPDSSGVFSLDSLQPGAYRVILGGQGFATETVDGVTVPGPEWSVTMDRGGFLLVRAEGLQSGQTARAALVDLQGRTIHVGSFFTSDPTFLLRGETPATIGEIKSGSYRLRVAMPGGAIVEEQATVAKGVTTEVTIR